MTSDLSPHTLPNPNIQSTATHTNDTHSKLIGYLLWIFGFTGSHRFYYGKPISGTIWLCTFGLLFIGWFVDLFLIPSMDRKADLRFKAGHVDYSLGWILLTFLGAFGAHRFYMGKIVTGFLYLITTGLVFIGFFPAGALVLIALLFDFWTLNSQISKVNRKKAAGV